MRKGKIAVSEGRMRKMDILYCSLMVNRGGITNSEGRKKKDGL